MSSELRYCEQCGERLFGRSDKRFCSDHCRNSFHNHRNGSSHKVIKQVNRSLQKNRRILQELYNNKLLQVKKTSLQSLGFNFTFHTGTVRTDNGLFYHCYDFAYRHLNKELVILSKRKID